MKVHVHFKFAHVLKLLCDEGLHTMWLNTDKSTECERQIAYKARGKGYILLDCSVGAKENRKEGGQSGPRYGTLGLIDEAYTV